MNNELFKEYLEERYFKDNQKLKLKTRCVKEKGHYFSQEITVGDYCLCEIQTFDCLDDSQIGHVPYCLKAYWDEYLITVQRFGELTDEDVERAIAYVLNQYESYWLWNVYLDEKHINSRIYHEYSHDSDYLRQLKRLEKKNEKTGTKIF